MKKTGGVSTWKRLISFWAEDGLSERGIKSQTHSHSYLYNPQLGKSVVTMMDHTFDCHCQTKGRQEYRQSSTSLTNQKKKKPDYYNYTYLYNNNKQAIHSLSDRLFDVSTAANAFVSNNPIISSHLKFISSQLHLISASSHLSFIFNSATSLVSASICLP
jgi:hypothetical protein